MFMELCIKVNRCFRVNVLQEDRVPAGLVEED